MKRTPFFTDLRPLRSPNPIRRHEVPAICTQKRKTARRRLFRAAAVVALLLPGSFALAQQPAPPVADPYKKEAAPAQNPERPPAQVSLLEETFSLPIADAFGLLHATADDAERYRRLVDMTAQGKATLERLIALRASSGQRIASESIDEWRYPTGYSPTVAGGFEPINVETTNIGDTSFFEVTAGPGTIVDLSIVDVKITRYDGEREFTGPNTVHQPTRISKRLTSTVSMKAGVPFLLDTPNPPFGDGVSKDPATPRIWLDFLTCQISTVESVQARSVPVLGEISAVGQLFQVPEKAGLKTNTRE